MRQTDSAPLFPPDFLWGAATSAYQIEGSPLADGAGESNWNRFAHQPGNTLNGDTGDLACDHYRRWSADIELMRNLGLQSYRFSISWSRILPLGTGAINEAGLDFYDKLVDGLLAAGIQPNITLFHWDLPAALDDRGGWINPDAPDWFAAYARTVFARLGDRVPIWSTFNEPWVTVDAGYVHGEHAPGHRNLTEAAQVAANLLRAHARAVQVYRGLAANQRCQGRGRIGLVVNLEPKVPASDNPADLAATRRADAYMNRQFLDPLLLGKAPTAIGEVYGSGYPQLDDRELSSLVGTLDFLGINYYTRSVTCHQESAQPTRAATAIQTGHQYTDMGWEVHPDSLRRLLLSIGKTYGKIPIYITENGAAFPDPPPNAAGAICDRRRVDYFRSHLQAVQQAIAGGADVRGYYAWSLFDNFEWSFGYTKRFGLIAVDFTTQQRTLKDSARYYQKVIGTNGADLTVAGGPAR